MAGMREKKHTFSVCAYGESPYLGELLRSLLPLREEGSGLILCTSTDNEYIRSLAGGFGIPVFVNPDGGGLGRDWNFALRTAAEQTGAELVTLAHQDDVYSPDYDRELKRALKRHEDISLFCTRYANIDENGRRFLGRSERVKRLLRLPLRFPFLNGTVFGKRLAIRFGNSVACPSCTYNLMFTGTEPFDERYRFVTDWDFLFRLASRPGRFYCAEKELLLYRIHQGAATKANMADHNREKEEELMFRKFWPAGFAKFLMHFYRLSYRAYDPK